MEPLELRGFWWLMHTTLFTLYSGTTQLMNTTKSFKEMLTNGFQLKISPFLIGWYVLI